MKELVDVKNLSTKVVGYRAGEDRNPRTYDWRPKASHTYAMMADGELCAKNVAAGKPPVMDGFPHKTRWM
jgi:hypothetical protein